MLKYNIIKEWDGKVKLISYIMKSKCYIMSLLYELYPNNGYENLY